MIIAERVHLKYSKDVVPGIILILFAIGGIVLSIYLESLLGVLICIALIILFIILLVVSVCKVSFNNGLPSEVIKYEKGEFVFFDEDGSKTVFNGCDVLDMDYKLKKTTESYGYFIQTTTWNYGRLRIWLRIPDNDEEGILLTIKNIMEPDRVIDRIRFIVEQSKANED